MSELLNWSSFEEDKVLMESWRTFLNEAKEELNEKAGDFPVDALSWREEYDQDKYPEVPEEAPEEADGAPEADAAVEAGSAACDAFIEELKKDPDLKGLIEKYEDDATIRGELRTLARNATMALDTIVIISALAAMAGIGTAAVTAAPTAGAGAAVGGAEAVAATATATLTETASVVTALSAVILDLLLLDFKGALMDLIMAIPILGNFKPIQKWLKVASAPARAAAMVPGGGGIAASHTSKAAAQAYKAGTSASHTLTSTAYGTRLTKVFGTEAAEKIVKISASKVAVDAVEGIGATLEVPLKTRDETEEEYAKRLKSFYEEKRALESKRPELGKCLAGDDSELQAKAKNFIRRVDQFAQIIPDLVVRGFQWGIEKVIPGEQGAAARTAAQAAAPKRVQREGKKIETKQLISESQKHRWHELARIKSNEQ